MAKFTKNVKFLPESVKSYLEYVIHHIHPTEIILFGSRARGDHREHSDFDFAVKGPIQPNAWTKTKVNLDENPISLYPIDLVLYEELGEDYKKNIQSEGKLIYG